MCALIAISYHAAANITDCRAANSDGQAICTSPVTAPAQGALPGWSDVFGWSYHLCDEAGAHFLREKAWCESAGGTLTGSGCLGAGMPPVFEGGLTSWATEFERRIHAACDLNMIDSGWGQTVSSYNCWSGGPKTLNKITVTDFRTFSFSGKSRDAQGNCAQPWAELVRAGRWRSIACPADYETRSKPGGAYGEIECWKMPTTCSSRASNDESNVGRGGDVAGNPIRIADCSKIQREVDIALAGNGGLQFVRTFASGSYFEPMAGPVEGTWSYWHHTYSRRIVAIDGNDAVMAVAQRESGDLRYFNVAGKELFNADGAAAQLQRLVDGGGMPAGWRYTTPELDVELYNAAGQLLSITMLGGLVQTLVYSDNSTPTSVAPQPGLLIGVSDTFGRALRLTYDSSARLSTVADPAGYVYRYAYDSRGRLSEVTYPDQAQRLYVYENGAFPYLLTGIIDENGKRFATYSYDSAGHAASTQHAGGAALYTLNVSTTGASRTVKVTDAKGIFFNNDYNVVGGALKRWRRYCGNCAISIQEDFSYDASGNRASYTDVNRNRTNYTYDLTRNLEIVRVEGLTASGGTTTVTRTISTEWHSMYRVPSRIAEPTRITTYAYDGAGNLLSKSVQATTDPNGGQGFNAALQGTPRLWTYTYGPYRRVATIDGPRTDANDTTTYTYYPDNTACTGCRGQIQTIGNALGQLATFGGYDANGRPIQVTDSNGVVTTLAYYPRGWLASRTVNAGQPDAETTTYGYDNTGQLIRVTSPDGSWIGYQYDDAHRLTEIADSAGNVVQYTLDAMGNRVRDDVYDQQDNLTRTQSRVYDALNRLQRMIGGVDPAREITQYSYDNFGNLLTTLDPLGRTSQQQYDARHRMTQVTDAANGVTAYGYDAIDRLLRVTDPRGLVTQYTYNGLGDLVQLASPDTGTAQFTYDDSGNLRTKIDARGQLTALSYDALNRVASRTSANGPTITYTYDQGTFGVGRLSLLNDGASTTQWTYDAFGRIQTKTQSLHGRSLSIGHGYAPGGKVNRISYPSGRVVTYGYDNAGRTASISIDGASLLNNATYEPFGPVNGWVWGNGTKHQRFYDKDGRVTAITFPSETADQHAFGYDLLDRLVSASLTGGALSFAYAYDAAGNRTQEVRNGVSSQYSMAGTSNRLQGISGATTRSMSYNANGSLTSDRGISFGYDGRERLISAGNTMYYVSGLDQRIEKSGAGANTASGIRQFLYNEQGQLLGEYDAASGAPIAEHIYLGDWPVGLIQGGTVYYVHPDQLGAPRVVTRSTDNQTLWAWQREPFGAGAVQSAAGFEYNLRFPGQYYDAETGLHYNYFRDYDPTIGRYVESDPIGLRGGVSSYAYVASRPLRWSDPFGLDGEGFSTRYGNWCGKNWSGGKSGPVIPKDPAGPIDSVDECCEIHDYCYEKFECPESCPAPSDAKDKKAQCDREFVRCLDALRGTPPQTWPKPPPLGREVDAYFFCQKAKKFFSIKSPQ